MAKKNYKKLIFILILIVIGVFLIPNFFPEKNKNMITLKLYDENRQLISLDDGRSAIVDGKADQHFIELIVNITNEGDVPLVTELSDINVSGPLSLVNRYTLPAFPPGELRPLACTSSEPNVVYGIRALCGDGASLALEEILSESTGLVPVSDIGIGTFSINVTAQGRYINEFGETIFTPVESEEVSLIIERDIIDPSIIVVIFK